MKYEDIKDFSQRCEEHPDHQTGMVSHGMIQQRLQEEVDEYLTAEQEDNLVEIADALADIIYIACGTAVSYGIPLDKVFEEVHRSNMAKLVDGKPLKREDGKVIKPVGWTPPDIAGVLKKSHP